MVEEAPPRRLRRELGLAVAAALGLALLVRGSLVELHRVTSSGMAPTLVPGDALLVSRLAYAVRLPYTSVALAELAPPQRGDVVVFDDPTDPSRRLVKRVVGLPGETVELREQVLLLDGVAQPRLELGPMAYPEPGDGEGADQPAEREETCRRWQEILVLGPVPRPAVRADPGTGTEPSAGAAMAHDLLQCRRIRAGRHEGPFGPVRPGHVFVLGDNRDRSADSRSGWEVPVASLVGRGTLVAWSWGLGGRWPWGEPWGERGVRIDRLFKPVE